MAPLEGFEASIWLESFEKCFNWPIICVAGHVMWDRARTVARKKRRWRFLTASVAFTRSTHPSSWPMDAGKYSKTTPPDAGSWKTFLLRRIFGKIQEQPLTHAHTHNKWTFCGDRRRCGPHCHRLRTGRLDIFQNKILKSHQSVSIGRHVTSPRWIDHPANWNA